MTPDGQTVLVADEDYDYPTRTGYVHRVNAVTGAIETLSFTIDHSQFLTSTETGSWDIVAMNNGKAFFTTNFSGGGTVPFHELNLVTNEITQRKSSLFTAAFQKITQRTWLIRDAGHSTMLMLESNTSAGDAFSYDAVTDSFVASHLFNSFHSDGAGAVSRNGQQFAVEREFDDTVWITSNTFAPITSLSNIAGGMIFDPNRDRFYGLDATHDEIVVYSTETWTPISHIPAGADLLGTSSFNGGVVSFNSLSDELYVSVNGGILAVVVVPEPAAGILAAYACGFLWLARKKIRSHFKTSASRR